VDPVRLVALRSPLAPVQFPNGKVFAVRELDAGMEKLRVEAFGSGDPEKIRQLYAQIVPDAGEDDWKSMTTEDYANLWQHAAQKLFSTLELVEAARKNGDAGPAAAKTKTTRRSRHSSPTTPSSTPSPGSPAPSASAGGISG
jgi:hypothetical protein